MKLRGYIVSTLMFAFFNVLVNAQAGTFDVQSYKQFLESHQNMNSEMLLNLHPAGVFKGDLKLQLKDAAYFDSISIKYNLTEQEKSLIQKNGFMVSERLSHNTFGDAFFDIYQKDLPVYVSTDAILHAFHRSYDRILKDVELGFLILKLENLLTQMHSQLPSLEATYSNNPAMEQKLKDVDVYLTVPLKLLTGTATPYYSSNNNVINEIMSLIEKEKPADYAIFSNSCRTIDFSQFKPRGHYVDEHLPQLAKYFRTMMWLGRIEIYLSASRSFPFPCPTPTFEDIQRQIIDAVLISELFEQSNVSSIYDDIENVLEFFIGHPDNVTLPNVQYLKQAIQITSAAQLLNSLKLQQFEDTLKVQSFANQLILSQILYSDPMSPDSIIPASAFLLFGQRFVIDSYVTGSVVYDRIKYNGEKICRLFPSTLDPMFALGNDAAAQLLKPELDGYHYSSNLAALRYLIDSYGSDFWNGTIYNSWLNLIKQLNPPETRNNLPAFMQTAAYWQKLLNTQLASWTQLRHDNLLYAKQSYTGSSFCSYPYAFVEPFPEFFESFKLLSQISKEKFEVLNFSPSYLKDKIIAYFSDLKNITDTLISITHKEISSTPLLESEIFFLKKLIYTNVHESGAPPFGGWYAKLFYDDPEGWDGLLKMDFIVADIHTVPTDCSGDDLGAVVHVGTGPINLGVYLIDMPDNKTVAFVGPHLSYYEYTSTNFLRLTDQEWEETYLKTSLRPSWVNLYLADESGSSRGDGLQLITGVEKNGSTTPLPETLLLAQNYPNPFNSTTIIRFTIPTKLSSQNVKLNIFDLNGELVKQLLNENLPAGNYLTRWNGTDNNSRDVTSGVYFYNLTVGGNQISGKMSLIK
ncbi:MAG: DUF3160 domain-containing protein [Ignavibacteriales bacterium]|nr:DUF3160 domain-containing protein [Ignavibacteriales bacterium]